MPELPEPITVTEALSRPVPRIEVPDGASAAVGPFEELGRDTYQVVRVSSFEDLQELGLIPQGMSEQDASDALVADDELHRERLSGLARASMQDRSETQARLFRRTDTQANLTKILQKTRRAGVTTDAGVIHTYHHLKRWLRNPGDIFVGHVGADDIQVGAGSTLKMTATVHIVRARTISIEAGGVLRFENGSVNVRCETLNGPRRGVAVARPGWLSDVEKRLPGYSREQRRE